MRRKWDKEHLLKLTLAVYKVTALFPVGDDLGLRIRESADDILNNGPCHIDEILSLFDLAEKKSWVDFRNFLVLRREYERIRQSAAGERVSGKTVPCLPAGRENPLSEDRQGKILAVMSSNGMVKIGDLIKVFPGVNRRTVLRDLDKLCQTGAAVKNGKGRGAHYVKNGHNHDTCGEFSRTMSQ